MPWLDDDVHSWGTGYSGVHENLLCLPLSTVERMSHQHYQKNVAMLSALGVQQLDGKDYPSPKGYCDMGLLEGEAQLVMQVTQI